MHYDQITLKQIVKTSTRLSICISLSEYILLLSIHRYKDFLKSAEKKNKPVIVSNILTFEKAIKNKIQQKSMV